MTALVQPHELAALLASPDHRVVVADATVQLAPARHDGDHRSQSGADAWAADHVPGSIHLDLAGELADAASAQHFTHLGPQALADALARRGIDRGTTVVAYDRGDLMWSARLWWTLRWIGIDVRVLDGGLPAWRASGARVTAPVGAPRPVASWTPEPRDPHWASLADVRAVVDGRAPGTLVCGLGVAAFAGTAPTRYARRGHLPGSINVPARDHLRADGRLLPPADLLAPYADAAERPLVLYCGGGISASLNALALHEAGVDDVVVYDGSLEEWAADPGLPLELTTPL